MRTSSVLDRATDGMNNAFAAAQAAWVFAAEAAVYKTARELTQFTIDDVWTRFPEGLERGCSIGRVMQNSAKSGIMTATDYFVRSKREATHGKPVTVWLSNIREGA